MIASGFTAAPVSQFLFFGVIASSIVVSITDTKYLFYIQVIPHLWQYKQAWRLLIWQVNLALLQLMTLSTDHSREGWTRTDENPMERPATTTPQSSSLAQCHFTTSASLSVYGALESSLWVFLLPFSFLIS